MDGRLRLSFLLTNRNHVTFSLNGNDFQLIKAIGKIREIRVYHLE